MALRPALPDGLELLEVRGIPFSDGTLSVRADRDVGTQVLEAPDGLLVELQPAGFAEGDEPEVIRPR